MNHSHNRFVADHHLIDFDAIVHNPAIIETTLRRIPRKHLIPILENIISEAHARMSERGTQFDVLQRLFSLTAQLGINLPDQQWSTGHTVVQVEELKNELETLRRKNKVAQDHMDSAREVIQACGGGWETFPECLPRPMKTQSTGRCAISGSAMHEWVRLARVGTVNEVVAAIRQRHGRQRPTPKDLASVCTELTNQRTNSGICDRPQLATSKPSTPPTTDEDQNVPQEGNRGLSTLLPPSRPATSTPSGDNSGRRVRQKKQDKHASLPLKRYRRSSRINPTTPGRIQTSSLSQNSQDQGDQAPKIPAHGQSRSITDLEDDAERGRARANRLFDFLDANAPSPNVSPGDHREASYTFTPESTFDNINVSGLLPSHISVTQSFDSPMMDESNDNTHNYDDDDDQTSQGSEYDNTTPIIPYQSNGEGSAMTGMARSPYFNASSAVFYTPSSRVRAPLNTSATPPSPPKTPDISEVKSLACLLRKRVVDIHETFSEALMAHRDSRSRLNDLQDKHRWHLQQRGRAMDEVAAAEQRRDQIQERMIRLLDLFSDLPRRPEADQVHLTRQESHINDARRRLEKVLQSIETTDTAIAQCEADIARHGDTIQKLAMPCTTGPICELFVAIHPMMREMLEMNRVFVGDASHPVVPTF